LSGWRSVRVSLTQQEQRNAKRKLTNHQTEIKQPLGREMVQAAALLAQHDARDDGGARRPEPAAQRDGVLDVHVGLGGEAALVVAAQHVQGDARDEVDLRVEADLVGALALALVRDAAVERVLRPPRGPVDGNVQLQVHRQRQADDVEARADVGAGARRLDDEGLGLCHGDDVSFSRLFGVGWWFVFLLFLSWIYRIWSDRFQSRRPAGSCLICKLYVS
jgi:hypothetical protein